MRPRADGDRTIPTGDRTIPAGDRTIPAGERGARSPPSGAGPVLVILAGGRGARFGGLKQLAPVGPSDEPLPAYTLHDAALAGFGRALLVCPPGLGARVLERIAAYAPRGMTLRAVEQDRPRGGAPWGTAHALLCADRELGGAPFVVANADDFYGRGAIGAAAAFLERAAEGRGERTHALVAYRIENTLGRVARASRALCVVERDALVETVELRDVRPAVDTSGPWRARGRSADGATVELAAGALVSMNLWAFRPTIMDALARAWETFRAGVHADPREGAVAPEFMLPGAVNALLAEGAARVRLLPTDEAAFGLTARRDVPAVRAAIASLVAEGRYPADLRSRARDRDGGTQPRVGSTDTTPAAPCN